MKQILTILLLAVITAGCSPISQETPTCVVPEACVGTWAETEQIAADGKLIVPEVPIRELVIDANGFFSVTWRPFESYKDFWGVCHFNSRTSEAQFYILQGNHIPTYFRGLGKYRVEKGLLVFEGLRFGHSLDQENALTDPITAVLGHHFKKITPLNTGANN